MYDVLFSFILSHREVSIFVPDLVFRVQVTAFFLIININFKQIPRIIVHGFRYFSGVKFCITLNITKIQQHLLSGRNSPPLVNPHFFCTFANRTNTSDLPTMNILLIASEGISLWEMIVKGGWLMIPLFLLSVVAVYIICERYAVIRKATRSGTGLAGKVLDHLQNNSKSSAIQECNGEDTPVAHVLLKGIRYMGIPTNDLRISMENAANAEMAVLEKGLSTLGSIANIAPMIGFLGTVVGMIQAFYDMSMAGNNINISLLSNGIYTAMVTTVAGLTVGIIASLGYNALVGRINRIATEMENASSEFIDTLYDLKK